MEYFIIHDVRKELCIDSSVERLYIHHISFVWAIHRNSKALAVTLITEVAPDLVQEMLC